MEAVGYYFGKAGCSSWSILIANFLFDLGYDMRSRETANVAIGVEVADFEEHAIGIVGLGDSGHKKVLQIFS